MTSGLRPLVRRLLDGRRYVRSPVRYWDARHVRHGAGLEGVGCVCLSEDANHGDYEAKWARLRAVLQDLPPESQVLDAGCGNGFLTQRMRDLGLAVEGVDFSQAAVASARTRLGDDVNLHISPLDDFRPGRHYDAVLSIDVLFHIVDDDLWRRTVENLARLADRELIIQDHLVDEVELAGSTDAAVHCRWRTLQMYREALPQWDLVAHEVYHLPFEKVTKDLLRFRRPATA